ncbi:hypothetical protein PR202_gb20097 [Eleusine coracana subsp. coracana]|uniref:Uncharacterized protein n=1 Tax=Eleusine coracana subsp. coracana TaxID=191504 RepID=A0AAV5FAJ4_ELECO|nr:hypothetical protein PR202_gb20097 [Eleusine coracana subsp. coracana]
MSGERNMAHLSDLAATRSPRRSHKTSISLLLALVVALSARAEESSSYSSTEGEAVLTLDVDNFDAVAKHPFIYGTFATGGCDGFVNRQSHHGRCRAYLSVPSGARSVRCPLCDAVTRVERHPHNAAVGFVKGLFGSIVSPGALQRPAPGAASQLPASYPRVRGCKKRALLVGISYAGTEYELRGTVNDVYCMGFLLRERFNFRSDCILVMTRKFTCQFQHLILSSSEACELRRSRLTEEDRDPYKIPTKHNIRRAMRWLVDGASSGDSLVFYFSGHGIQEVDTDGDEMDGYDEAICPLDVADQGAILDDEINETIVRPLGPGVKLHAIVDACHSGTILDLDYLCRISRTGYWQWENQSLPYGGLKCTSGGLAISISGCSDNKTAEDTTAFSGSISTGAMTYSFIKAVESQPGATYGRLITGMRATIRSNGGESGIPGRIGTFFCRTINFNRAQEPQLCTSEPFDIYRKPFLL